MSDIDTGGAAHAASDAGLGRKVGPLPIWAWAVLIVGGGFVIFYIMRRGASTTASANGAGLSTVADQTAAGALSSMYGSGGNANGYTSGYSNNQQYEQAAISELSGSTQYTPLQVQGALGDLFAGNSLTADEQAIINKIEGSLGAPPEYVPNPTSTPSAPNGSSVFTGNVLGAGQTLVQPVGSSSIYVRDNSTGTLQALAYNTWVAMGSPRFSLVSDTGNPFASYQVDNSGTVYGVDSTGNKQPLTYQQWQALGTPAPTKV